MEEKPQHYLRVSCYRVRDLMYLSKHQAIQGFFAVVQNHQTDEQKALTDLMERG